MAQTAKRFYQKLKPPLASAPDKAGPGKFKEVLLMQAKVKSKKAKITAIQKACEIYGKGGVMSIIIEKFLMCDGVGCGATHGVDSRHYSSKEHRESAKIEGWSYAYGKDWCPTCRAKGLIMQIDYKCLTNNGGNNEYSGIKLKT